MKHLIFTFLLGFEILVAYGQGYETNSDGSNNFSGNSFDTTDYSIIPTVNKLGVCFDKSFIYRFEVDVNMFRAVHIKTDTFPQIITIQKLQNGKWCNRLEFYKMNKMEEIKFQDVNNDGYPDIIRERYFDSEVYFYNPSINNFIDSVCGELNYNISLIDTAHNIYCDFQSGRQNCGNIYSTLYTFKNYSKFTLYNLDLYNCDSDNHSKITKLILSKCSNGQLKETKEIRTIKLRHPLNIEKKNYFNNKKFWKINYKKLLM